MSGHAQEETDGVREHHQELKQRKAVTETQDKAGKARRYRVRLGTQGCKAKRRQERKGGDVNLEARIMRLEEETHWMYRKMREMMGFSETNVDEGSAAWRREDDGDEWEVGRELVDSG